MIIFYHANDKITAIKGVENQIVRFDTSDSVVLGLHKLAAQFPDAVIVWCHEAYRESLNIKGIESFFHHHKMMLSHNPSAAHFMDKRIGYVEESLFINVNKEVTYPTWQMSSAVGVIHASVLTAVADKIKTGANFDYYLNSLAKVCMPMGLFCYDEPKLLLVNTCNVVLPKASLFMLFRFVQQHYKTRWVFLLLFNLMMYERKFPLFPFLFSHLYRNRTNSNINLNHIKVQSSKKMVGQGTIDVIIPTIGRKAYLYDVLYDLRNQTHLPVNVIIVEQNPHENSVSELDFISNESWPFTIKHSFTHQAGACNARNVALAQVTNEWVFFADDDIRIATDFFQKALECLTKFGAKAVSLSCLQKGEKQSYTNVFQWGSFGSGCSIVFTDSLKQCKFNMGYEFGFGEDGDFGRQLRHHGVDVLYLPEPQILHLKAPMGGFRTKPALAWQNDPVQPKPSPTVMLYQILHQTKEQILGYKTILLFKYYKVQKIKNPLRYFINFRKQWKKSVYWANELNKTNEI